MVPSKVLFAALSSTGLVCLAPNLFLLAFPGYASGEGSGSGFLSLGQALAAGSLLGDVFLHTLPHAGNMEEEKVGLWVMIGFTIFMSAEMLLRSAGRSTHSDEHHHHHHNNSKSENGQVVKEQESARKELKLSPAVLLNLSADALHNFTDGLAIGASFSIQKAGASSNANDSFAALLTSRGGLATISILLHEIPHELGDFCTLVKAGCSKKQAIYAQFATAVAAMIGTVVGVFAVEGFGGERLLYITAGGFVYLAAVTILPEVLNDGDSTKFASTGGQLFRFRLAQLCAFCTGIAFMYVVSILEEHDHSHGHHHHHHEHHHELDVHDHHSHHDHDHGHHDYVHDHHNHDSHAHDYHHEL